MNGEIQIRGDFAGFREKDRDEYGHTRPMSDPLKEIPRETASNPRNENSPKNHPKIMEKGKCTGEEIQQRFQRKSFD